MADIRQNTTEIDNFNRADENPIAAPWAPRFAGSGRGRILGNELKPVNTSTWAEVYTNAAWTGDEQETWGVIWSGTDPNEFWYIGLLKDENGTNTLDGWLAQHVDPPANPSTWSLRKLTNESFGTIVAGPVNASFLLGDFDLAMLRREGNDMVIYASNDAGANWTEELRHTDSTYAASALHPALGVGSSDGTGPGWRSLGGGPTAFLPQFYRRVRRSSVRRQ